MSKVKWREEVRTDKPSQRIIRTVFLGALAAVLTVIFHYGPGIHGMRQLAVSLAGFSSGGCSREFQRPPGLFDCASSLSHG
jgi:hypothetical protein